MFDLLNVGLIFGPITGEDLKKSEAEVMVDDEEEEMDELDEELDLIEEELSETQDNVKMLSDRLDRIEELLLEKLSGKRHNSE